MLLLARRLLSKLEGGREGGGNSTVPRQGLRSKALLILPSAKNFAAVIPRRTSRARNVETFWPPVLSLSLPLSFDRYACARPEALPPLLLLILFLLLLLLLPPTKRRTIEFRSRIFAVPRRKSLRHDFSQTLYIVCARGLYAAAAAAAAAAARAREQDSVHITIPVSV